MTDNGKPKYFSLMEQLRNDIVSGVIRPGEKLPSVRELAASLAINPNTIQRSYRELESLGLINTVPGKGAFAATDHTAAQRRTQELTDTLAAAVQELKLLGVSREDVLAAADAAYGKEEQA